MPNLLLVMRRRGNLKVLGTALQRHGYVVTGITSLEGLETALMPPSTQHAALVDITGFHEDVWSMCELLQRHQVPFLVISGPRQRSLGSHGLEFGAASVLEKPLVKQSLLKLLEGLTR